MAWAELGGGNDTLIIVAFVVGGLLLCCLFCVLMCFQYGCLDIGAEGVQIGSSDDGRVVPEVVTIKRNEEQDEIDAIKKRLKAKGRGRKAGTRLGNPEDLDEQMLMSERDKILKIRNPDLD
jgi:hypothetical protein